MGVREGKSYVRGEPSAVQQVFCEAVDLLAQAPFRNDSHGEVADTLMLADVVNGNDEGVVEFSHCVCLGQEALFRGGFVAPGYRERVHDFQRDEAVEPELFGFEDDAHAASADFVEQFVVAEWCWRAFSGGRWRLRLVIGWAV